MANLNNNSNDLIIIELEVFICVYIYVYIYVVNNAVPGTWRPHANFLPDWFLINVSDYIISCGCGYVKTTSITMSTCV